MSRPRPKERPLREIVRDGWSWDSYTARQQSDDDVRRERDWQVYLATRPGSVEALAAMERLNHE